MNSTNEQILALFPENEDVYYSVDTVVNESGRDDQRTLFPREYLNSLTHSGLPSSALKLKKGVPLMILRNLDPANGVCNGTRCTLIKSTRRVLYVSLISGEVHGKKVFIPRIKLSPPQEDFGFHMQ